MGITRGANKYHLVRATLESLAYQTKDLIDAMVEDLGEHLVSLKVDGGASANDFLMQFQADILNKEVCRPVIRETTALGAAYLAGLATGVWSSLEEISQKWSCDVTFSPAMEEEKRAQLLSDWHKAVGRSLHWAKRD